MFFFPEFYVVCHIKLVHEGNDKVGCGQCDFQATDAYRKVINNYYLILKAEKKLSK